MVKKVLICFCCSIVLVLTGISQAVSVKGKVTDDKGTPVAGVSVVEKTLQEERLPLLMEHLIYLHQKAPGW